MPWIFGRKKKKEKPKEEVKEVKREKAVEIKEDEKKEFDKEFEEYKRMLNVETFDRYAREGRLDEYIGNILCPSLKAIKRRLIDSEKHWYGKFEEPKILELLDEAMKTYMFRFYDKLVLPYKEIGKIVVHPLFDYWLKTPFVELKKAGIGGVPTILEVIRDENIESSELYIKVHRSIAEIGLGIPKEYLKNFEKEGARCDYILSRVIEAEPRMKSEKIKV